MNSRRRWFIRATFAVVLGILALFLVAYLIWHPTPPAGGPRIGVSTTSGPVSVVRWPTYEASLARAGGRAVPITPPEGSGLPESAIDTVLDGIDALLLGGGDDVTPALYGSDADNAARTDQQRDEFEIQLIHRALERGMPILGICRGIQILNVAHGGTIRNLRADKMLSDRHGVDMVNSWTAHEVNIVAGTRLAGIAGAGVHQVNSWHGQAVGRVGDGLRVCATADDGVIEAIERPDHAFVIGIQWHPEFTVTNKSARAILRELIRQADAYRTAHGFRSASSRGHRD